MDHYSILDQNPSPVTTFGPEPVLETDVQQANTTRTSPSGLPAALAATNVRAASSSLGSAAHSGLRFPGEDGGRSLAGMAQRDLDAALQLLAERAQYITEASGAAIALRRSHHNDMLCRASAGANAPELGALLSTESGLSGESVRTRSPLRCDDAERDPRVNRDGCRELGISSVVVMPIVREEQVLGVFELFSGKPGAFGERDLSALQRLTEMVETAVKLAETAHGLPSETPAEVHPSDEQSIHEQDASEAPLADVEIEEVETGESLAELMIQSEAPDIAPAVSAVAPPPVASTPEPPKISPPRKPVLWSAAVYTSPDAQKPAQADQSHVPPVLRNLRQCWACGFPVSEGRKLCVECEEKQWRGQLRVPGPAAARKDVPRASAEVSRVVSSNQPLPAAAGAAIPPGTVVPSEQVKAGAMSSAPTMEVAAQTVTTPLAHTTAVESDTPIFSGGIEPSESWFSANKYILGALLIIVGVITAIVFLR